MNTLPDFEIVADGIVSRDFLTRSIHTYHQAIDFIKKLPYGRNSDKNNLATVFLEHKGTCSTKHAILKMLADEHALEGIELTLGMFRMNGSNTPPVAYTLKENGLEYIPEAHIYLRYGTHIFDFTRARSSASDFAADLLTETVISPLDIGLPKVILHKEFLSRWLSENEALKNHTLEDIWAIREQCIQDLSQQKTS